MSLLSMIQDVAVKVGIRKPTTVIGNMDQEIVELLAFANEEGKELMRRGEWQALLGEVTFTSVATETQTAMIPADFDRFVNETFWNRTKKHPLNGPLTPQEWQQIKAWTTGPVTDSFRYRGSNILINPVPAAGQTFAFEYVKNTWCQTSGGTAQSSWAADTDIGILNEHLMGLGIKARYKMAKGLPFETDLAQYETQVTIALGVESPKRRIRLASIDEAKAGVVVPEGDWSP